MLRHLTLSSALVLSLAVAACGERDAGADPAADVTAAEDQPVDPAAALPTVPDAELVPAAEFARRAALSNMFEIQASELAIQKGVEPRIREYAQMMITDHRAAMQQMQTAMPGMTPPTALAQEWEEWMQDLRGINAVDQFSAEYVDKMVTSHERAVAMFERYAQGGDDAQLRQMAQQMLPTLRRHLELARALDTADAATTTATEDGLPGTAAPN